MKINSISLRFLISLLTLILVTISLIFAKGFLIPICFGVLVAGMLLPLVKFLEKRGINTTLAIFLSIIFSFIIISFITIFFYYQILQFTQDLPVLKKHFERFVLNMSSVLNNKFGVEYSEQTSFMQSKFEHFSEYLSSFVGNTMLFIFSALGEIVLVLVYVFMILEYRLQIKFAFLHIFNDDFELTLENIFTNIKNVMKGYTTGLLLVAFFVLILLFVGLSLMGIKHAIFIAIAGAILNVIPYLGISSIASFSALYTYLLYDSSFKAISVLLLFIAVHALESNILTPKIIGSRLNINPFAAILAIIIGSYIWGIPGMILSLPMTAVLKVICEELEEFKAIAFFLGDLPKTRNKGKEIL